MNKLSSLLVITCCMVSHVTWAQGKSHSDPADIGVTVNSIIQIGSVQTSNYDVAVTVLDTARGVSALDKLSASDQAVPAPATGFEYLLARVRFELNGRVVSDTGSFDLASSPFEWVAYSSSFSQYEATAVAPPAPVLQGSITSGESREGWLVFTVGQDEARPLLMFDPSTGGAEGRGKKLFFKLY